MASLSRKHTCTDYVHRPTEVIRTSLALLLTTPMPLDLSPSRTRFHLKFGSSNGCLLSKWCDDIQVPFFFKGGCHSWYIFGVSRSVWNSAGLINSRHMAWHSPADPLLTSAHLFLAMLFAFFERDLPVKKGGRWQCCLEATRFSLDVCLHVCGLFSFLKSSHPGSSH